MSVYSIHDLKREPEKASEALWYLRGLRDAFADRWVAGTDDEELKRDVENVCSQWHSRLFNTTRQSLKRHGWVSGEEMDLFDYLCQRIGQIERDRCRNRPTSAKAGTPNTDL